MAQDAAITLWCGGGVTGGGSGLMVDQAGLLHRQRQQTVATPRETTALPGPPAPLAAWQALLDAARFEAIPRGAPANMTCSLARGRHAVLWGGDRALTALPPQLAAVVEAMRAASRDRAP